VIFYITRDSFINVVILVWSTSSLSATLDGIVSLASFAAQPLPQSIQSSSVASVRLWMVVPITSLLGSVNSCHWLNQFLGLFGEFVVAIKSFTRMLGWILDELGPEEGVYSAGICSWMLSSPLESFVGTYHIFSCGWRMVGKRVLLLSYIKEMLMNGCDFNVDQMEICLMY
jgi:hypothetical protein